MRIQIDLNKTADTSGINQRTNVYVWKNLDHLKTFYTGIVDPREIDSIAGKLMNGTDQQGNWQFRAREGLGETLNESCLCNMVEIVLLENKDALAAFLTKPVEFIN